MRSFKSGCSLCCVKWKKVILREKEKVIKTNAVRMVEQAKVPYAIHEYDVDTAHLDAIHAAQGMGIPVEEVYKLLY